MKKLFVYGYLVSFFCALYSGGTWSQIIKDGFNTPPYLRVLEESRARCSTASRVEFAFLLVEDRQIDELLKLLAKANITFEISDIREIYSNIDPNTSDIEVIRDYLTQRLQGYHRQVTMMANNLHMPCVAMFGMEESLAPIYTVQAEHILTQLELITIHELIEDDLCMQKLANLLQEAHKAYKVIDSMSWGIIPQKKLNSGLANNKINLRKIGVTMLYYALQTERHAIFWLLWNTENYRNQIPLTDVKVIASLIDINRHCAEHHYGNDCSSWSQEFQEIQNALLGVWQHLTTKKQE